MELYYPQEVACSGDRCGALQVLSNGEILHGSHRLCQSHVVQEFQRALGSGCMVDHVAGDI